MNLIFAWKMNRWGLVFGWFLRRHGEISRFSLMRSAKFGDKFMILIEQENDD